MKIFVLIVALAVGVFLIARLKSNAPKVSVVVPVAAPAPAAPSPGTAAEPTALRRPIVRTHQALGEVKERNGAGEF